MWGVVDDQKFHVLVAIDFYVSSPFFHRFFITYKAHAHLNGKYTGGWLVSYAEYPVCYEL
jgi:hypothetical protein